MTTLPATDAASLSSATTQHQIKAKKPAEWGEDRVFDVRISQKVEKWERGLAMEQLTSHAPIFRTSDM